MVLKNSIFEVDEFLGANEGLIVAEIGLKDEQDSLTRSPWSGKEVTGEERYYNSQLSKRPFNTCNL